VSDTEILATLREAKSENEKQKALVVGEMEERGSNGQLWTNGQCAAWPAYEASLNKLNQLREEFGV